LKATHEEADTRMVLHMLHCKNQNAKSSLFSGKERKLGKLEGRGTLRFSITLLIGCTDFDIFFRFPADSNDKSLNLNNLKATHEEADMRMILHMLHFKNVSNCRTIAVSATDTDVFLLLLRHAYGMDIKIWMMAGTSRYIFKMKHVENHAHVCLFMCCLQVI
jgi:hypothetical protein